MPPSGPDDIFHLPRPVADSVLDEARAARGREVCGLLGRVGERWLHLPVTNIAADPTHRYDMDPAGQVAAFRRLREAGATLAAIYHSHPEGLAVPSTTDRAEAAYDTIYLIAAPGAMRPLRAWRLADGEPSELKLETD